MGPDGPFPVYIDAWATRMSQLDPDPQFIQGLRLLHSSNKDSADQLRTLLDEAIKQKYGLTKMLCNVLHKKYTMEEPVLSDHSSSGGSSSKKSKSSSSSSKNSSKSSKSGSPDDPAARDTPTDILQTDDNLALEILEDDLTCIICKGMDVGARNRLVECVDCHALYHQECHNPPIQDSQIDVPRLIWYCSNCLKSHQPSVASSVECLPAKDRGSPKTVTEGKSKESKKSSGNSKHGEKYKNPSSQSQSNGGAPSNSLPKPNIHIIAGDRRVKEPSKKSKQEKRGGTNGGSGKHSGSGSLSSSSSSNKSSQEKSHKTKVVTD